MKRTEPKSAPQAPLEQSATTEQYERTPASVKELASTTDDAFGEVEEALGVWMVSSGHMQEDRERRGGESDELDGTVEQASASYEAWVHITDAMEEIFFGEDEGTATGRRLIKLLQMDDDTFALTTNRNAAQRILDATASIVEHVQPLVDRLRLVTPVKDRKQMLERLFRVERTQFNNVDSDDIDDFFTGSRTHHADLTLFGALRELGRRLRQSEPHTTNGNAAAWELDHQPQLQKRITLSNPMTSDPENVEYWTPRVASVKKREGIAAEASILSLSESKTRESIIDLQHLADQLEERRREEGQGGNLELINACRILAQWMQSKLYLYAEGDEHDLSRYDLTREAVDETILVFDALAVIKEQQPRLFVELMGVNPGYGDEKSRFYGSLLHSTLYNTQEVISQFGEPDNAEAVTAARPAGFVEMKLVSYMDRLLDVDKPLGRFGGALSKSEFKALGKRMEKEMKEVPDEHQGGLRAIVGIMAVPLALESAVADELERLRKAREENYVEQVTELTKDVHKPLTLLNYIGGLPTAALGDYAVRKQLEDIFPAELIADPERLKEACREAEPVALRAVFQRIPMELPNDAFFTAVLAAVDSLAANPITRRVGAFFDRDRAGEVLEAVLAQRPIYTNNMNQLSSELVNQQNTRAFRLLRDSVDGALGDKRVFSMEAPFRGPLHEGRLISTNGEPLLEKDVPFFLHSYSGLFAHTRGADAGKEFRSHTGPVMTPDRAKATAKMFHRKDTHFLSLLEVWLDWMDEADRSEIAERLVPTDLARLRAADPTHLVARLYARGTSEEKRKWAEQYKRRFEQEQDGEQTPYTWPAQIMTDALLDRVPEKAIAAFGLDFLVGSHRTKEGRYDALEQIIQHPVGAKAVLQDAFQLRHWLRDTRLAEEHFVQALNQGDTREWLQDIRAEVAAGMPDGGSELHRVPDLDLAALLMTTQYVESSPIIRSDSRAAPATATEQPIHRRLLDLFRYSDRAAGIVHAMVELPYGAAALSEYMETIAKGMGAHNRNEFAHAVLGEKRRVRGDAVILALAHTSGRTLNISGLFSREDVLEALRRDGSQVIQRFGVNVPGLLQDKSARRAVVQEMVRYQEGVVLALDDTGRLFGPLSTEDREVVVRQMLTHPVTRTEFKKRAANTSYLFTELGFAQMHQLIVQFLPDILEMHPLQTITPMIDAQLEDHPRMRETLIEPILRRYEAERQFVAGQHTIRSFENFLRRHAGPMTQEDYDAIMTRIRSEAESDRRNIVRFMERYQPGQPVR